MPMTLIIQRGAPRRHTPARPSHATRPEPVSSSQRCLDALANEADATIWPTHRLRAYWVDTPSASVRPGR